MTWLASTDDGDRLFSSDCGSMVEGGNYESILVGSRHHRDCCYLCDYNCYSVDVDYYYQEHDTRLSYHLVGDWNSLKGRVDSLLPMEKLDLELPVAGLFAMVRMFAYDPSTRNLIAAAAVEYVDGRS